jgi:hypothetical protein
MTNENKVYAARDMQHYQGQSLNQISFLIEEKGLHLKTPEIPHSTTLEYVCHQLSCFKKYTGNSGQSIQGGMFLLYLWCFLSLA